MPNRRRPPVADVAGPAPAADHDEYECPGCQQAHEQQIVADVYGCPAERHCTQATLEQHIEFGRQIAERLAAWHQNSPEKS